MKHTWKLAGYYSRDSFLERVTPSAATMKVFLWQRLNSLVHSSAPAFMPPSKSKLYIYVWLSLCPVNSEFLGPTVLPCSVLVLRYWWRENLQQILPNFRSASMEKTMVSLLCFQYMYTEIIQQILPLIQSPSLLKYSELKYRVVDSVTEIPKPENDFRCPDAIT